MGKLSSQAIDTNVCNVSNVFFGPGVKLCHVLGQGDLKTILEGQFMSNHQEPDEKEKQINSFLGRLAYAAQAQEFVSNQAIPSTINQALLFRSYCMPVKGEEEGEGESESKRFNFSLQTGSMSTRIGYNPLYKRS